MATAKLDESTLTNFEDAAAGHAGLRTDPNRVLVIKPCHPEEVTFYEESKQQHHAFAELMPAFMGTLGLTIAEEKEAAQKQDPASLGAALQAQEGSSVDQLVVSAEKPQWVPSGGQKLETDVHIVLENATTGLAKPNVLDVKLGSRLWDDNAPPAKRAKLDSVAANTTSATLGFRLAGMRVWQPETSQYKVFDKWYGRTLSAQNVRQGFDHFFSASSDREKANIRFVLECCVAEVDKMISILETEECRMYSVSILITFEGDPSRLDQTLTAIEQSQRRDRSSTSPAAKIPRQQSPAQPQATAVSAALSNVEHQAQPQDEKASAGTADQGNHDDDDDDSSSSTPIPKFYAVKMIDFAHSKWTPGLGPDQNILFGLSNLKRILEEVLDGTV